MSKQNDIEMGSSKLTATNDSSSAAAATISNNSQPPARVSDEDGALLVPDVGAAIAADGRNSISTICPYCKKQIMTETVDTKNPAAQSSLNVIYILLAFGILLCVTLYSIANAALKQDASYLWGAGIGIALAVVIIGLAKCMNNAAGTFQDVTHFCPNCRRKLGMSDGLEACKRVQRRPNQAGFIPIGPLA